MSEKETLEQQLSNIQKKFDYPYTTDVERKDYEIEMAWIQKQIQDKEKRKAVCKLLA